MAITRDTLNRVKNQYGTLLTNFKPEMLSTYTKTLEWYNKTIESKDRYTLVIGEGSNRDYTFGLYYTKSTGQGLSEFWRKFEEIRDSEKFNTAPELQALLLYATKVRNCMDEAKTALHNPNIPTDIKGITKDIEIAVEALLTKLLEKENHAKP